MNDTKLTVLLLALIVIACKVQSGPPTAKPVTSPLPATSITLDGSWSKSTIDPGTAKLYALRLADKTNRFFVYLINDLNLSIDVEVTDDRGANVPLKGQERNNADGTHTFYYEVTHGGTYNIRLSAHSSGGKYSMVVRGGCGGGEVATRPILSRGQTVSGELTHTNPYIDYVVRIDESLAPITLTLNPDYNFSLSVDVYSDACNGPKALNSSGANGRLEVVIYQPKFSGTYLFRVRSDSNQLGKFSVSAE
jgi:hypothetical protein